MNLVTNAVVLGNGDLQLTAGMGEPDPAGHSGGQRIAWLTSALSSTNSFSATFGFSLRKLDINPMADGITFALQKGGTNVIGKTGGDIGYGRLNAVGSVVQTWSNNRAGLNTDGDPYNTQSAPTNLGLANVVLGSETVSYDASTHMLTMTGALDVDGTVYLVGRTRQRST